MKVGIIYHRFLDDYGKERLIGGIQTYILNIAMLCVTRKWEPIIFQFSKENFKRDIDGVAVIGLKLDGDNTYKNISKLYAEASRVLDIKNDIIIFGADHCSIKTGNPRVISIQHGISWDMPIVKLRPNAFLIHTRIGAFFWKEKLRREAIKRFDNCHNRVCVDYNFINWYKTMISGTVKGNVWVVPNFADILSGTSIDNNRVVDQKIKIIFARRFIEYRGSRLMAVAVKRIVNEYDNVEVTFAGEGPDEDYLQEMFISSKNVNFIKYLPDEALDIISKHDISIIPSLASEGTSLSVAEAMSVGCAVIATSVGGITNMIIDGYNGLMISPDVNELYLAISELLDDTEKRVKLAKRGHEVFKHGFCIDRWKNSWVNIIQEVDMNNRR